MRIYPVKISSSGVKEPGIENESPVKEKTRESRRKRTKITIFLFSEVLISSILFVDDARSSLDSNLRKEEILDPKHAGERRTYNSSMLRSEIFSFSYAEFLKIDYLKESISRRRNLNRSGIRVPYDHGRDGDFFDASFFGFISAGGLLVA